MGYKPGLFSRRAITSMTIPSSLAEQADIPITATGNPLAAARNVTNHDSVPLF